MTHYNQLKSHYFLAKVYEFAGWNFLSKVTDHMTESMCPAVSF